MTGYTGDSCPAQPIRVSFRRVLSHVVSNAEPPCEQKELIMIMHENGLLTTAETYDLIQIYGLARV